MDSATLLILASSLLGREKVLALTVVSPIMAPEDLSHAFSLSSFWGIRHQAVRVDHLALEDFSRNPPDRCYHCKRMMYGELLKICMRKGYHLADGTLAEDLLEDRPGLKAVFEYGVKTPWLEGSFSKGEIRELARLFKLKIAPKEPSACLVTRFYPGEPITLNGLTKVRKVEGLLKALGFRNPRLRIRANGAYLEVKREESPLVIREREIILSFLKDLGFERVYLDLRPYQRLKKPRP